jgi:type I restriction enzyme S subunit
VTFEAGITGAELVRFADAPSRARRRARNGDTIVSTVRTYLRAIAPVWNQPDDLIVSTGFAVIRARPPMDVGYLSWVLRSNTFVESVVADSVGVSYPAIAPSVLGSLPVPAPPPAEQHAIADFLDRETAKVDALIATQERLIALLDEKRQATITHAVTKGLDPNAPMKESGVPSLGRVRASWPVVRLKAILRQVEQGWSPQCENRTAEPDEWGVLKVGCVNGTRFDETENKALPRDLDPIPSLEVKPGDVLMSRANTIELVGSVSLVTAVRHRLLLCDKLYRLHIERHRVDPRFIVYLLTSSVGRAPLEASATGASSSMKNISQESVKDIWLPCPTIEEQGAVADFLDELSGQISAAQRTAKALSEELRERRTALITAAVTGQIDVTRSAVAEAAK